MNSRNKKLLICFVLLIFLIPTVSFLLSRRLNIADTSFSTNRNLANINQSPNPNSNSTQSPLDALRKNLTAATTPAPQTSNNQSASDSASFGPVLSFKVTLEGRPTTDQHTKMFVGIAPGGTTNNPNYVLQVNVDVPSSGQYSGVSLAGLLNGTSYTAYLKGLAQLVKAVPFTMNPAGVNLNNGNPINLTTGDLNQDNTIDQSDYNIEKAALGATPGSPHWNEYYDFDLDGVINIFDLAIISNNLGKVGDSGKWYSTTATASSSANFILPPKIGGTSQGGSWLWLPGY